MTLYLKYRPQTIDELDLPGVRENLKKIIKSGSIPHAFLFSGPKGTGKTSAARILAKVINCQKRGDNIEPCNICDSCISITKGSNIDVLELDAASNRGIDDIRSLKEGIALAPANALKKVYIIDEAHMLTLQAANAFLKTLEEPPDHVIFILATTNPEKLPGTVISRLTQINFTKANSEDITRQLNRVAKGEKFKVSEKAIEKIAKKADGSFRDAVKILESMTVVKKEVSEEDVESIASLNTSNISIFFELLAGEDVKKNLEFIENLVKNGVPIRSFNENLIQELHASILAKNGIGEDKVKNFKQSEITSLIDLIGKTNLQSPVPQLPLEIAIVKFLNQKEKPEIDQPVKETKLEKPESKEEIKPPRKFELGPLDENLWQELLLNVKGKNVSIEALLRAVKPLNFDGKNLTLGVYYQFHKEHLEDAKTIRILEDTTKTTLGIETLKITFELIEKEKPSFKQDTPSTKESLTPAADKDIIDAAKEIFG